MLVFSTVFRGLKKKLLLLLFFFFIFFLRFKASLCYFYKSWKARTELIRYALVSEDLQIECMYLQKASWNCVPLFKLSSRHFDVCFYVLDMLFCYYRLKKKKARASCLEPLTNWILYLKVNFIEEITQINHSPFPAGSLHLDASLNLVRFTLFICQYSTRDLFMLRCSLMSFPLHCYGIFVHSFWSRCCQSQTLKAIIPLTFNALDQGEFYFTT